MLSWLLGKIQTKPNPKLERDQMVICILSYMSGLLQERLGHHAQRLGITISFSHEEIPMDTAGPLALARKLITDGNNGEPFFVMNADVTADFPFKKMLQFHKVYNLLNT